MSKIILDLCGGTGAWSKPYRDAGYDVRVITLPDHDVTTTVKGRDFMIFCDSGHRQLKDVAIADVHGILAAPPCTMFSLARTTAKTPRDFDEGLTTVRACLEIIWACRARGNIKWWAMENPVGFLRQFMGKPALTFRPCDYGDPYTKRTDLWGYFTEPVKRPVAVEKPKGRGKGGTRAWSFAQRNVAGLTRTEMRAVTPPGFARAFFEANP